MLTLERMGPLVGLRGTQRSSFDFGGLWRFSLVFGGHNAIMNTKNYLMGATTFPLLAGEAGATDHVADMVMFVPVAC